MRLKLKALLAILMGLVSATTFASSGSSASGVQSLRTFDGQTLSCMEGGDIGRVGYRVTSTMGNLRRDGVDVTVALETMRCVNVRGVLSFEKSPLKGRLVNPMGGFVEFSTLEFVSYTPNLKVIRNKALSLSNADHMVTFSIPLSEIPGILPRNVRANGEMKVVLSGFLRGEATLGDAVTGRAQRRLNLDFGPHAMILAPSLGTLNSRTGLQAQYR